MPPRRLLPGLPLGLLLLLSACASESPYAAPTDAQRATLHARTIGAPAPDQSRGEWIRGSAFTPHELTRTRAVVVWSLTCGPCLAAIPAIEAASAEFPITTILAHESGMSESTQRRLIAECDPSLRLRVALDTPDSTVSRAWLDDVSGERSYPTAFVLDSRGNVAWIGHPSAFMLDTLRWADSPAYSIDEARRRANADAEALARAKPVWADFWALMRENRTDEAFARSRDLDAISDVYAKAGFIRRAQILWEQKDHARLIAEARAASARWPDDPWIASRVWPIVALCEDAPPENLAEARPVLERTIAAMGTSDALPTRALAECCFVAGDRGRAAELLRGLRRFEISPERIAEHQRELARVEGREPS
jgi:hypothetical protein